MKLKDYVLTISNGELTKLLKQIDQIIDELHHQGYSINNLADTEIINGDILDSIRNRKYKCDFSRHEDRNDIIELCTIGIFAYNKKPVFNFYYDESHSSYDSVYAESIKIYFESIIDNLDAFLQQQDMPDLMKKYYTDVFSNANVNYLNWFIEKNEDKRIK